MKKMTTAATDTTSNEGSNQSSTTQPLLRSNVSNNEELVAPNYKPRYCVEETKLVQNDNDDYSKRLRSFSPTCSVIATICCRCCCCCLNARSLSRRKILLSVFAVALLFVLVNLYILEPLTTSYENFHTYNLAKKQSYGLFDRINHSVWKGIQTDVYEQREARGYRKKKRGTFGFNLLDVAKFRKKVIVDPDPSHYANAGEFYDSNWKQEFKCHHDTQGDYDRIGDKVLCNPRRIVPASQERLKHQKHHGNNNNNGNENGCIIYTSAANLNDFSFEKELLDFTQQKCEIHVFSPNKNDINEESLPEGIQFHPWGFSGTAATNNNNNTGEDIQFKTIPNTLQTLGHCGSTIDVLSIDCEGCEFDIYKDLFSSSMKDSDGSTCEKAAFMQILVQLHGAPNDRADQGANDLFKTFFDNDYVIFLQQALFGEPNEKTYGFLKLSSDFFI